MNLSDRKKVEALVERRVNVINNIVLTRRQARAADKAAEAGLKGRKVPQLTFMVDFDRYNSSSEASFQSISIHTRDPKLIAQVYRLQQSIAENQLAVIDAKLKTYGVEPDVAVPVDPEDAPKKPVAEEEPVKEADTLDLL